MRKLVLISLIVFPAIVFLSCGGTKETADLQLGSEKYINFESLENRDGKYFQLEMVEPYSGHVRDYSGELLNYKGSYNSGMKHGIWTYYYDNGEVKREESYDNSKKAGDWVTYDGKSNRTKLEQYQNDIPDGRWEEYKILVKKRITYQNGIMQGNYKELNVKNQVQIEGTYENDKKDGAWNELLKNGYREHVVYSMGKRDGLYTLNFPSGRTQIAGEYLDGNKHDEWITQNEERQILKKEHFEKGMLEREELFRTDGTRVKVLNMLSGKLHGEYVEYFQNDTPKEKGQYVDGEKDGTWFLWGDNGVLILEENYKRGKFDGEQKYFLSDGSPKKSQLYSLGQLNGETREWYPHGTLRVYQNYKLDKLVGVMKSWYENGNPKAEISYHNGSQQGHALSWWENGNLKLAAAKKDGHHVGIRTNFNDSGVVVSKVDASFSEDS
ncbi:MAG: hypothetical protein HOB84_05995 [Candidatus Marinimicrobia bacterium]|jgi:uncharacterized protein|nr:hypothetical protein [Bacteroidota bacterium]MBT4714304.1 hypothetical protein [Candidatus Neomarinimicrobiota bacterium]MBT4945952.1 hypothetical protein [Candidatus Neomarinimicrobiota bacterium]MBT5269003.1 hypothetical protein [Candidatus Neomarinimicrobiota bacterium]MBT7092108.1 hypothetical protein [Bacteroidota bacterium]